MPPHLVPQCRINPRLCSPSYRPPEIEATVNGWSVRELERQISSSLYERLALSRDKANVPRLAREGHVVEKAADLIKNPLVLEFLGLEQKPAYSEARQKRFTFDNKHFFVDLVFYGSSGIGWIGGSAVDTGGVEIKTAEVKVDGVAEALAVTKAAR